MTQTAYSSDNQLRRRLAMKSIKTGITFIQNASPLLTQQRGQNPKQLVAQASSLLLGGMSRALQSDKAFPGAGMGSKRSIVTGPTFDALIKATPKHISVEEAPPYQPPAACEAQAGKVLQSQLRKSTPQQSLSDKVRELFNTALGKTFSQRDIVTSDDLLDTYKKKGSCVLRGPGLGTGYRDHAINVFAVMEVPMKNGVKKVVCALDFNDRANDPETTASRETAASSGNRHVSELSHEEANKNGAKERRIRFIDADALAYRMKRFFLHYRADRDGTPISGSKAIYPKTQAIRLSPKEEQELTKILEQVYDTEVEKFADFDYSRLRIPDLPGVTKEDIESSSGRKS
jgi:hypothetical protein